jgi:GR25 family glycosyltransferase involved in LPS biosynthesis
MSQINPPNIILSAQPDVKIPKQFCFIISSYNNSLNIHKNLYSIINQTNKNWRAIYINDVSSDDTEELFINIMNETKMHDKFIYIKNETRMYQMYNKYIAYKLVRDLEIVCILDGDDWLLHDNVLDILNHYYTTTDYKIITSHFKKYENGIILPESSSTKFYSDIELKKNTLRYNTNWYIRHLKTGYGIYFKSIPKEYLTYEGKWLHICTDCAEMYSAIELAKGKILQIQEPLYVYNTDNSKMYQSSYYISKDSEERKNILTHIRTRQMCKFEFPKTYIINLSYETAKKINMMKQLVMMNNTNYEFIEAVDGSKNDETEKLMKCYLDKMFFDVVKLNNEIITLKKDYTKYINTKQHITKGSLGLIQSIFCVLQKFVDESNSHILILEDDVFTLTDIEDHMFIHKEMLENKDLIYLGCHNNRQKIYHHANVNDIFINVKKIPYLIYGTYAIIISKKLAMYILEVGIQNIIQLNLSWDLLLNFIREYTEFNFFMYNKELFVPDVMKEGINGIRDKTFYEQRDIKLENYIQ